MSAAGVTGVVRVADEHLPALAAFYRRVWSPDATEAGVRQARAALAAGNVHGAGTDVPTFLFLNRGESVGHLSTIPVMLRVGGRELAAHWLKGLMVVPEFRGGPVGFLMIKEALRHVGWSMAMVVSPEARRLFTALGYRDLGAMGDFVRVLDAAAVLGMDVTRLPLSGAGGKLAAKLGTIQRLGLAPLAGAMLHVSLGVWGASVGRGRGVMHTSAVGDVPAADLDDLWTRAASGLDGALARDAAYLQPRYPEPAYAAVTIRDDGRLTALAVVRRSGTSTDPRLAGIRVATLSDLVAVDAPSALAAIGGAEQLARSGGAQALIAGATHQRMQGWLGRRGFLPVGRRVHFLLRAPAGSDEVPAPLEAWWLTRGDSDADEVF